MTRYLRILIFLLILAACDAEATPYPMVGPPTPTDPVLPTDIPPVRYALAANILEYIPQIEYELIAASGMVEQLTDTVNPADLGVHYDIIATYGDLAGWTRSAVTPHVMLVINPTAPPLTPQLADVIRRAVDTPTIVAEKGIPGAVVTGETVLSSPSALRTELANLGRPDGLQLVMGYAYTPGVAQIAAQLAVENLDVQSTKLTNDEIRTAFADGRIHLALVTWTTPEQQQQWRDFFGAEFTRELYNLPISYLALPDLPVSFTPGGWPVVSR